MKFWVDAHLPKRLARLLQQLGHDALHTLDLPDQNRSSDETLIQIAEAEECIVITKDSDFVDSFLLVRRPTAVVMEQKKSAYNKRTFLLVADLCVISSELLPFALANLRTERRNRLVEIINDCIIRTSNDGRTLGSVLIARIRFDPLPRTMC